MKKNDKFILIVFLIIIFGIFACYPIKIVEEIFGIVEKNNDGTWKTYDSDATLIDKIKINIDNRVTNYFPGYSKITELFKNTNEKINEKIYDLFDVEYIPAGTNSDGEYLIKDLKNNAYYAFSNHSNEILEDKLNNQINFWNSLYEANSNINFSIYLPNRLELQKNIQNVQNYRDMSIYVDKFISSLNPNIKVKSLTLNNIEEYNKYFYKSDHHWNMYGALVGYEEIMNLLSHNNYSKYEVEEHNMNFFGSFSRTTRNKEIYDKFYTVKDYNKNYKVLVNNDKAPSNFKPLSFENLNKKKSDFYDWYVGYFYGLYGNVVYDFNDESKNNLLIISDSYAWQIDYLIASNYNKTHVINIMYDEYLKSPLNYTKYIEENQIDDVLILQEGITTIFDSFNHNFNEKVVW